HLLPEARFCSKCGKAAADTPALRDKLVPSTSRLFGERKYVTVLFADVVGSTSSVAGLDPEDARELMEPAVMQLADITRRHGGTISTIMGDRLMALFGAPLAQEDHAIRACAAALAMLDAKERSFGIRVGLNSGEIVAIAGDSEGLPGYDAVGQTVNLAARLEN